MVEEQSTFSKIVDICLHDIRDLSDVWYPLIQSKSIDTPKTLAGLSLKSLLNESLKNEQIKEQVKNIVSKNEPINIPKELIEISKLYYFKDHPELIKDSLKDHIRQHKEHIFEIKMLKSTCRLMVGQEDLAEISIRDNYKWPLYYARFAAATEIKEFRISVSAGYGQREILQDLINILKLPPTLITGNCTIECYKESIVHSDDHTESSAIFEIKHCTNVIYNPSPQPSSFYGEDDWFPYTNEFN